MHLAERRLELRQRAAAEPAAGLVLLHEVGVVLEAQAVGHLRRRQDPQVRALSGQALA